jgi:hypothetical protein
VNIVDASALYTPRRAVRKRGYAPRIAQNRTPVLQNVFTAQNQRGPKATAAGVVLAGGAGFLGAALVRQLAGGLHAQNFGDITLLVTDAHSATPRGLADLQVPEGKCESWPSTRLGARAAVIAFEPRRDFYKREAAIWVPEPEHLSALCHWLYAGGVRHVVIVLPHATAQLPEGLRSSLATLNEQAAASVGYDHVVLLRMAQAPRDQKPNKMLERLAQAMLSILRYMIPERERPVRAQHVAELAAEGLAWALQNPKPAVKVASPETVWQIATAPSVEELRLRARAWLGAA